jgi:hypothetical protein
MYIYQSGNLRDSVQIRFTVRPIDSISWTWKTEYPSLKKPIVKEYILRIKDKKNHIYITDEGKGIEIVDYQTGNKLYSLFEVGGVMLSASYELRNNDLIFEVVSGKKEKTRSPDIINYSTASVQRVVMRREK